MIPRMPIVLGSNAGRAVPDGWAELVSGMQRAFDTDPRDLLIIAFVLGLGLLFLVNLRVARRVERSIDARVHQRRLSHPPREGRRQS